MRRLLLLSTGLLAACSTAAADPQTAGFPIGIDEAYARLAGSKLDDLRYRRQCGILIHLAPYGTPNQSVTWVVTSSGREVLRFTANLQAVDAGHTRVTIDIPPGPDGREAYSGDQFLPRPAFNQPLRPAIEEQVAAILEGRDFDMDRVPRPTDGVCSVQRSGLESGRVFHIDDEPGTNSRPHPPEGWGTRGAGWGR